MRAVCAAVQRLRDAVARLSRPYQKGRKARGKKAEGCSVGMLRRLLCPHQSFDTRAPSFHSLRGQSRF